MRFFLCLFLFQIGSALAADLPHCDEFDKMNEKQITKLLLSKKGLEFETQYCYRRDPISQQGIDMLKMALRFVGELDGLPDYFMKKWGKLTWDQARFVAVDFPLCLEPGCSKDSELVAKNFSRKKLGVILINRAKWKQLKRAERFSIIWHEVLGVLKIEENSYEYSSMVRYYVECEKGSDPIQDDCYDVLGLSDPSFLKKK